jgi:inositol transporter-like SP family MFS transporter
MTENKGSQDMTTPQPEGWRDTILAGLANYIDAGSIVAGSVALGFWAKDYALSDSFVGLIGAFSANAISAGIGALIGGVLCDKFGRKRIYQYDMLFYAFGMLFLVFAAAPWMLIAGFVLVGLAVGADIPASWSLIAEQAPDKKRGAHSGVAQMLWYLGPVAVLVAAYFLKDYGIAGARWIFIHLFVLALLLTVLRSKMSESRRWENSVASRDSAATPFIDWKALLSGRYLATILYLSAMYGLWNLWAGYNGFFTPYLIEQHNLPDWVATLVPAGYFGIGIFSIFFIFMKLADRVNQRTLFGVSALLHVLGMAMIAVFGFSNIAIVIAHFAIMGIAGGFGAQSFFQLWSADQFPTAIRSTAQGVTFAIVRISLGLWSLAVPSLAKADFTQLCWILTGFLVASGVIGYVWAPRNEGKSLEQLAAERGGV